MPPTAEVEVVETEQQDLDGIPSSSPLGKAAKKYLRIKEETETAIEANREKKGEAQDELIEAMREAKRTSFVIDGQEIHLRHKDASDKIAVTKATKLKG